MSKREAVLLYSGNKLRSAHWQFERLEQDKAEYQSALVQADPGVRQALVDMSLDRGVEDCYQAVLMASQAVRIAQCGRKDRRPYAVVLRAVARSVGVDEVGPLLKLRPLLSDWRPGADEGLDWDAVLAAETATRGFAEACCRYLEQAGIAV